VRIVAKYRGKYGEGDIINAFEYIFYAYGRRVTDVRVCDEFYAHVCDVGDACVGI
jgi:hypothetical protein